MSQLKPIGVERPDDVKAFLVEYNALCAKHGMKVSYWVAPAGDESGFRVEALGPGEGAVVERGGVRDLGFDERYVLTWVES